MRLPVQGFPDCSSQLRNTKCFYEISSRALSQDIDNQEEETPLTEPGGWPRLTGTRAPRSIKGSLQLFGDQLTAGSIGDQLTASSIGDQLIRMELSSYYQGVFLNSQSQHQWPVKSESDQIPKTKLSPLPSQDLSPACHDCPQQSGFTQFPPTSTSYPLSASPSYPSYTPYAYHYSSLSPPAYPSQCSPTSDYPPSPSSSPSPPSRLPRIPPLHVLQKRRLAANARERKRADKINSAYGRLRQVLPGFHDREISKFEALQLAQDYIKHLARILEEDKASK